MEELRGIRVTVQIETTKRSIDETVQLSSLDEVMGAVADIVRRLEV